MGNLIDKLTGGNKRKSSSYDDDSYYNSRSSSTDFLNEYAERQKKAERFSRRTQIKFKVAALLLGALTIGGGIAVEENIRLGNLHPDKNPVTTPATPNEPLKATTTPFVTPTAEQTATPFPTKQKIQETNPTIIPIQEQQPINNSPVQVNYDKKTGLPISYQYVDEQTNKVVTVNLNATQMTKLREAAKKGVPQLFGSVKLSVPGGTPNSNDQEQSSGKHLEITSIPKDVVSTAELGNRGITLINAPETKLYIRESAFASGGTLEAFTKKHKDELGLGLEVILVPGPTISTEYMMDPRYDEVKKLLPKVELPNLDQYRKERIAEWTKALTTYTTNLQQIRKTNPEMVRAYEDIVITSKVKINEYETATPAQLTKEILDSKREAAGLFVHSPTKGNFIFLPTKQDPNDGPKLNYTLIFDSEGKVSIRQSQDLSRIPNVSPTKKGSFPDPSKIQINPNAKPSDPTSYPFGGDAGLKHIVEHEMKHLQKIVTDPILKGTKPNNSEYDTDMDAMTVEQNAWRSYELSGDTSGYPWVFVTTTPNGTEIMEVNQEQPFNTLRQKEQGSL